MSFVPGQLIESIILYYTDGPLLSVMQESCGYLISGFSVRTTPQPVALYTTFSSANSGLGRHRGAMAAEV